MDKTKVVIEKLLAKHSKGNFKEQVNFFAVEIRRNLLSSPEAQALDDAKLTESFIHYLKAAAPKDPRSAKPFQSLVVDNFPGVLKACGVNSIRMLLDTIDLK
jgi:hypothetical protein